MSFILVKEAFASSSNTVHVITHSRDTLSPVVSVYNDATNEEIIPESVIPLTSSQVQITLYAARAIRGVVI